MSQPVFVTLDVYHYVFSCFNFLYYVYQSREVSGFGINLILRFIFAGQNFKSRNVSSRISQRILGGHLVGLCQHDHRRVNHITDVIAKVQLLCRSTFILSFGVNILLVKQTQFED